MHSSSDLLVFPRVKSNRLPAAARVVANCGMTDVVENGFLWMVSTACVVAAGKRLAAANAVEMIDERPNPNKDETPSRRFALMMT